MSKEYEECSTSFKDRKLLRIPGNFDLSFLNAKDFQFDGNLEPLGLGHGWDTVPPSMDYFLNLEISQGEKIERLFL